MDNPPEKSNWKSWIRPSVALKFLQFVVRMEAWTSSPFLLTVLAIFNIILGVVNGLQSLRFPGLPAETHYRNKFFFHLIFGSAFILYETLRRIYTKPETQRIDCKAATKFEWDITGIPLLSIILLLIIRFYPNELLCVPPACPNSNDNAVWIQSRTWPLSAPEIDLPAILYRVRISVLTFGTTWLAGCGQILSLLVWCSGRDLSVRKMLQSASYGRVDLTMWRELDFKHSAPKKYPNKADIALLCTSLGTASIAMLNVFVLRQTDQPCHRSADAHPLMNGIYISLILSTGILGVTGASWICGYIASRLNTTVDALGCVYLALYLTLMDTVRSKYAVFAYQKYGGNFARENSAGYNCLDYWMMLFIGKQHIQQTVCDKKAPGPFY
ncbi:hypothetical protein RvY_00271-2 [Ramazzottius varieornatus]|uniref:Uncharacterized protein n=1 Tax=Ramazzottius varieornatus TaxID=947166 RepID=A0A1D1UII9_RAMVA|nr:hypothetical protein RvY_00271-2 [Ramazzottius varieornatus]